MYSVLFLLFFTQVDVGENTIQYETEIHRAYDSLKSDYEQLRRQHLELIRHFRESELRRLSLEAPEQNFNKFRQGDITPNL